MYTFPKIQLRRDGGGADQTFYRGTSLIRNTHPHRITIGP